MGRNDKGGDIEAGFGSGNGENQLYPGMMETPAIRWAFIRKVYIIVTLQLSLTAVVAGYVVGHPAISQFMMGSFTGIIIYIALAISVVLVMIPLHIFQKKHPLNLFLLVAFTVLMALLVGLACATKNGDVILQAAILTGLVVVGLTLYTFWAVKRGHDFSFLGSFLFCALLLLLFFSLMQMFMPFGGLTRKIYSLAAAMIFSGFIVYDTGNLIKDYNYDEYISASICLYMDIINLFLALLGLMDD